MNKTSFAFAAASVAAFLSLSACNNEPETLTSGPVDPQAEALAKAPPINVPPSIQATRTYRCRDNSLIYTEFLTDNTVRLRTERNGTPTVLTGPEGEQGPFTSGDYSISANAETITYSAPGKGSQSCRS